MNTQCIVAEYSFYSSDGNIRCLCADQSGRKINEVGEEAR